MLIREDCPSPFNLVSPSEFAMVAGRQRPDRRVDEHSWGAKAHSVWATRMNTKQLPPALHPNGGLYLYGLPHFNPLWRRIDQASKRWGNHGDLGADESIIGNLLWSRHRQAIRFLPQEFNTVLCQNAGLLRDGYSPTYITHYAMGAKAKLADAKWQTADWPWTSDDAARELANQIRRGKHDVGCLLNPKSETVCKLLILFPELKLCGVHTERMENITADPASAETLLSVSHTSYLLVRQILADLGPLSRRYRPIFCHPNEVESVGLFDFVVNADQFLGSRPTVES
ncbi:hypothetical protein [Rhodopirellula europaea]|uniref:hypothetical protein n=1 Tax=Rhodopirellula europaea TaxID=1263866 RepID=UPI003D28FE48